MGAVLDGVVEETGSLTDAVGAGGAVAVVGEAIDSAVGSLL